MKLDVLKDRASLLEKARTFFKERNVLEVDCPLMGSSACIDLHIDLLQVRSCKYPIHYLHSSPEYFMKRLLAQGCGDIYQLAHVFRDEECSPRHNPEFMMAEWYRQGFSLDQMIDETIQFIELFLGKKSASILSYRDIFHKYAGLDYVHASLKDLADCLKFHGIEPYNDLENESKDAHLNLILGTIIEPCLKSEQLVVIKNYPASQAALAKTHEIQGELIGERFEIYYEGIELANGYRELCDPVEQRRRLEQANLERAHHGKETLPIDEAFLQALEAGLPECSGVAVGFDRLMMLRCHSKNLSDVMPFSFLDT